MTTLLPESLHERLDALACRVRRLRRLRGISLLALALTSFATSALLVDLALGESLGPIPRAGVLAVWLSLGAVVAFVSLIRPLRRRLDRADLAAAVERKYPDLHERLTSSVELSSGDGQGAGAAELVVRLMRETDAQARGLDFSAAVSARSTIRLAVVSVAVVVLSLLPAAFAPRDYGRLLSRFLLPWRSQADFAFVIHPGDIVAARGRPLTVRVTLIPRDSAIVLPRHASLVLDQEGAASRHDLVPDADDPATFRATFSPTESGRYRVEAGMAVSEYHTLTAVTPTDLAAHSPVIVVTLPAKAESFAETQTLTGMVDLSAFAGSEIVFRFAFDRPTSSAVLEWSPEGQSATSTPLALGDEGRSATWSLSATRGGAYRLVISGEHGIQTVREGGRIIIRPLPETEEPAKPIAMSEKEADTKARVEDLADRQKELADRAAEAKTKKDADEVAKAQAELARELDRLTKDDATLKAALESARAELTREAADRAKALADAQRDLAQASEETEKRHDAERLVDLAKRQRSLLQKIQAFAKETATAARANFARPLADDAGRAAESMSKGNTQKALDDQDRASRDLERLARDLDRLAEAAKDPRENVRQLSRLQDDLARRVREEAERKDDARPLIDRLKDLSSEQATLRSSVRDLGKAGEKAVEQQEAAEKAMAKGDTTEALARMEAARLALRESANKMTDGAKNEKPSPLLPSKGQAKQARELAAEQRALRQDTKDAADKAAKERRMDAPTDKEPPTAKLARDQAEIARQVAKLAPEVEKEQGPKSPSASRAVEAKRSTGDAARDLERGSLEKAQKSGEDAAKALRQLADDLAKATRTPGHDTLEKARKLLTRQEELNLLLGPSAKDLSAQRRQQGARQEELVKQAGDLGKVLDKMPGSSEGKAVRQAEAKMKSAQAMAKQGNQSGSQSQREEAAKALEQAAARMGRDLGKGNGAAGDSVREARAQMNRAQDQLGKGEPGEATGSMRLAEKGLRRAGGQLARGATPGGAVDGRMLPKELTPYIGKRWGELPGELRTRLVQQMKTRYGDDYARSIKLYFEQLADTNEKK